MNKYDKFDYTYQEKDSAFECGFHSFLGQNRTQFSISFFIFGLLFLLFDLEILLVYPYSVSSYSNDIYGLVIMMVFFVLLTLGFIFELGKNALTIDSRQTLSYNNYHTATLHVFINLILKSKIMPLTLFRKKVKDSNMDISLNNIRENSKIETISETNEYNNIIFYPISTKEWFNSICCYNISYIKPLIIIDMIINNLIKIYLNRLYNKTHAFKRRRHNRIRYSAKKIYSARAELLHTNSKILIIFYIYNKPKSLLKWNIRKIVTLQKFYKLIVRKWLPYFQLYSVKIKYKPYYKNRIFHLLKNKFFVFQIWSSVYFTPIYNLINYYLITKSKFLSYKNYRVLRKIYKLEKRFFNKIKGIYFNKYKLNNLSVSFRNLGLISIIEKLYDKSVIINFVEQRSIHLNSDVFSSAVALKLRNRKNKAIRVLSKAIVKMVRIPDLHSRITFDDLIKVIGNYNIINTIKQQVVNGVRFQASGRLTRRLTAMRAIVKVRYVGSLRNMRSSYNKESSTLLRGYAKSNLQYININSKTRNGTFGVKTWVSSHNLITSWIPGVISVFNSIKIQALINYLRILKDKASLVLEWESQNLPKPHAFTSLLLQSSTHKEMSTLALDLSTFELWVRRIPFPVQMRSKANDDVNVIKSNSDELLLQLDRQKNSLLNRMDDARYFFPSEIWRIDQMKDCVNIAAERGIRHIKQGNNSAIQNLDNSSSIKHLLYENDNLSFLASTYIPYTDIPYITLIMWLFKFFRNDIVKLYLKYHFKNDLIKLYLSICCCIKKNLKIIIILLLLLLAIYYNSSFVYCDAPRAWELYFQDSASPTEIILF